ncbi:hypothetical protein THAOC_26123, partial [Thalassiosira oceanica]
SKISAASLAAAARKQPVQPRVISKPQSAGQSAAGGAQQAAKKVAPKTAPKKPPAKKGATAADAKKKAKGGKKKETKPSAKGKPGPKKSSSRSGKGKSASSAAAAAPPVSSYSAQQAAVNDMMRRALEEDQYSALGSIVETDSSDDDEEYAYDPSAGRSGAIDRHVLQSAAKKYLRMDGQRSLKGFDPATFRMDADDYAEGRARASSPSKRPRGRCARWRPRRTGGGGRRGARSARRCPPRRGRRSRATRRGDERAPAVQPPQNAGAGGADGQPQQGEVYFDGDEGAGEEEETSIFGATQGAKNATWVECDRCKKVRSVRPFCPSKIEIGEGFGIQGCGLDGLIGLTSLLMLISF